VEVKRRGLHGKNLRAAGRSIRYQTSSRGPTKRRYIRFKAQKKPVSEDHTSTRKEIAEGPRVIRSTIASKKVTSTDKLPIHLHKRQHKKTNVSSQHPGSQKREGEDREHSLSSTQQISGNRRCLKSVSHRGFIRKRPQRIKKKMRKKPERSAVLPQMNRRQNQRHRKTKRKRK